MLFNSYEFIFGFLPITLAVFYLIGKQGHHRLAIVWLVSASFFFYAWWNLVFVSLILFSILFNYSAGLLLSGRHPHAPRGLLFAGVAINWGKKETNRQ